MKKALLASSAIVGASLLAAPASAGTVGSADNMSITLGGYYWFQVNFLDEDVSAGHGRGYKFKAPDSEVHLKAYNTADNGIEYGVTIELEAGTDAAGADEAYAEIDSDAWGLVQMGDNDGAAEQMHIGAFQTNKSGVGTLGGLTALAPAFHNQFPAFLVRSDWLAGNDATKINYFSPRFAGFQLGAALTPDVGNAGLSATETDNDGDFDNVIDLGANYVGTFGDVGIQVGAFGQFGDDETPTGAEAEDLEVWGVGAVVNAFGFDIGANYRDHGDTEDTGGTGGANGGHWWAAGIGYSFGPWGVDAHYAQGEADGEAGVGDAEVTRYGLGVGYTVAPGWKITGDYELIEGENYVDNNGTFIADNEAQSFMITNFFTF